MATYDLSHPVESGMQVYPGDPPVSVTAHADHQEDGYRVAAVAMGSHSGTHVDAPAHTEPGGATLDEYPVSRFRFAARRVDLRGLDAREAITRDRLSGVDADAVELLALWTGWDAHWGTEQYLDHPYLAPGAAEWCAERGLAVASDTLNPDPTPTDRAGEDEPAGFGAHHALLGADCLVLENLRGLGAPPATFTLHAYPLRLDGDGAPVRAVAVD